MTLRVSLPIGLCNLVCEGEVGPLEGPPRKQLPLFWKLNRAAQEVRDGTSRKHSRSDQVLIISLGRQEIGAYWYRLQFATGRHGGPNLDHLNGQ